MTVSIVPSKTAIPPVSQVQRLSLLRLSSFSCFPMIMKALTHRPKAPIICASRTPVIANCRRQGVEKLRLLQCTANYASLEIHAVNSSSFDLEGNQHGCWPACPRLRSSLFLAAGDCNRRRDVAGTARKAFTEVKKAMQMHITTPQSCRVQNLHSDKTTRPFCIAGHLCAFCSVCTLCLTLCTGPHYISWTFGPKQRSQQTRQSGNSCLHYAHRSGRYKLPHCLQQKRATLLCQAHHLLHTWRQTSLPDFYPRQALSDGRLSRQGHIMLPYTCHLGYGMCCIGIYICWMLLLPICLVVAD